MNHYWQNGKRVRVKQSTHPRFESREDALQYDKKLFAARESEKSKLERRMIWRDRFQDFAELLKLFESYQKQLAPNSYQDTIRYLKQYTLNFYLNLKAENNVASWHQLFREYRDWVNAEAHTLRTNLPLSYSSKNKAIHALNSFLECLGSYGRIPQESVKVCPTWSSKLLGEKNFESVVSDFEFQETLNALQPTSRDAWVLGYHSGLRINEILSLTMEMIKAGNPPGAVGDELTKIGLKAFGFIMLTHQLPRWIKRDANGKLLGLKPLKGRPKIAPKYDRIIPILDKECWNTVVKRYKAQEEFLKQGVYGHSKANYLLWDKISYTCLLRALGKVTDKTWHDLRHTFCTNFVGQTRNFFLARAILGHKSDAFERYLHIYERVSLEAQSVQTEIDFAL